MQVARTLKVTYTNPNVKVTGDWGREGSILGGDLRSWCQSIRTELSFDSEESPDQVTKLVQMAEASCYTIATIRNTAPVELIVTVNGQPFEVPPLTMP